MRSATALSFVSVAFDFDAGVPGFRVKRSGLRVQGLGFGVGVVYPVSGSSE